jgi:hypothetical protein
MTAQSVAVHGRLAFQWLVLFAMGNTFCGDALCGMPFYTAAPIDARIVDAETGEPVPGVFVIAHWQLVTGSLDGERYKGQLEVKETTTDANGAFHFDGFTKPNPSTAELRDQDPQILIFKPGYRTLRLSNDYGSRVYGLIGPTRTSQANGTTIRLQRYPTDPANDNGIAYEHFGSRVAPIIEDCEWKSIPNALLAMTRERERIKSTNPRKFVDLPTISTADGFSSRCGSAVEFFKARELK